MSRTDIPASLSPEFSFTTGTTRPPIALIGAGRVALAFALALRRAGWPLAAIGSRAPDAVAQRLAQVGWPDDPDGAEVVRPLIGSAQQAADAAELVLLTVPDDQIERVTSGLTWWPGQAVVHCSGATEVAVLDSAARQGALTGGFHPLQIFSDPRRAAELLAGSSVAIEAGPPLRGTLEQLAAALGLAPITLPPGMRARYHASAGHAASALLVMLQEAVALWRSFGVDEAAALAALLPLSRGTLDAVAERGLAGALSGPISRGDVGVLGRHLADLARLGSDHEVFYRELARRQLGLAQASGRLDAEQLARLTQLLGPG
ncbi:MAG: hypothetical protein RLY71_3037 [Pseudomonadota bacterium]|jgi:predicted short-subunit dehydrogenase-like oxidoreductase (DUF2520 family)